MTEQKVLARLNEFIPDTLMAHLGMKFTAVDIEGKKVEMTMPVNPQVHQPMGLLHGGASAALAESVGSAGSMLYLERGRQAAVGIQLSCNHIRSKTEGEVVAKAQLIHQGKSTHVWEIKILDEEGRLISDCKLTNMVVDIKK